MNKIFVFNIFNYRRIVINIIIIIVLLFLYSNYSHSQTATVEFYDNANYLIGGAELVDSWFLGLPAFTFKLKNMAEGEYFLAIYSGFGCKKSDRGIFFHLHDKKLAPWHTDRLLKFTINKKSTYSGVLSLKPDKVTSDTRELLTVSKMIGHPIIIYNKHGFEACGIVAPIN